MSAYDHFSGIAVFVMVVESGSFAAAAHRLNLSRSAVGKTVARLEEKLGVKLLHRTTRTQSLTEDGQLFYERCLRAVTEIREGEAMLDSGRLSLEGKYGCRCRCSSAAAARRRFWSPWHNARPAWSSRSTSTTGAST